MNQITPQPYPTPQQNISENQDLNPFLKKKQSFFKTKKFGYMIGLLLIVVLISGTSFAFFNKPKKPTSPQVVEIEFWGKSVDETLMASIIEEFESQNPLIKVVYERQIDSAYKERLATRLQNDSTTLPDLMEIDETWITEFSKNLAKTKDTELNKRFANRLVKNNSIGANQYGVPFKFDSLVLAYNTKHLQEKGYSQADFNQLDWSSLISRAEALSIKTQKIEKEKVIGLEFDRGGIAIGSPQTVTNADKILQLLLLQNDAPVYKTTTKRFLLDEKTTEILDFYGKFSTQNIWDDSLGSDIEAFADEKVSMVMVTASDLQKIQELNPELSITTVLPPKISIIKSLSFSSSIAIPIVSAKSPQAMEFINFLTNAENMTKIFENKNDSIFIPATQESLDKIPRDSPYSVFSDLTSIAERFDVPNYTEVSDDMTQFLNKSYAEYYVKLKPDRSNNVIEFKTVNLESLLNRRFEE